VTLLSGQARNELGAPGGAESFLRGAQNYVQYIFPVGQKFSRGDFVPMCPPSYRPVYDHLNGDTQLLNLGTVFFTHTKWRGVSV